MKLILNEDQYNMLYLLKEGDDIYSKYTIKLEEVNKKLGVIYNRIGGVSIAEIPNFNDEFLQLKSQISSYIDIAQDAYNKMTYFLNNQLTQDEFDSKWSDIDIQVDNLYSQTKTKANQLDELLDSIIEISKSYVFQSFKNAQTKNIG